MKRLENRVALVTGGKRGIGLAIAERFLEEGARVLVTDLDAPDTFPEDQRPNILYRRLDVTDDANWQDAIAVGVGAFGPLDILVNNAGVSRSGNIATTTQSDWRFIMETNALSAFLGCQHAVRQMGERGGAIINIASARALRTGSDTIAYCASKAAVLSLTESVALHCGQSGIPIRCNAICPGVVETPQMHHYASENGGEEFLRKMAAQQVLGRAGTPCEIADAAVFLASAEAGFITGAALRVDGGFAIRDI